MRGRRNIKLAKTPNGKKLTEKNPLNEYTPGKKFAIYNGTKQNDVKLYQ